MNIIYTDKYLKSLKKYNNEKNTLDEILIIIKLTYSFTELCDSPLVQMYHFERLKYNLSDYYSFRLDKSGGLFCFIA